MIIIFAFPDFLVRLFSSESDIAVIDMAKKALLLYAPSYLFTWFIMTVSGVLTGLEKAIEDLSLEELKCFSEVFDEDIYDFIDYENILNKGIKKNLK